MAVMTQDSRTFWFCVNIVVIQDLRAPLALSLLKRRSQTILRALPVERARKG